MRITDLTVNLSDSTPVFPGDPKLEIKEVGSIEKDNYLEHQLCLPTHIGTHIDAPAHMIRGGKLLSDYPISKFIGDGVLIDARDGYGVIDLKQSVSPGSIILFNTGWDKKSSSPEYFTDFEQMPEPVADWLIHQKPKMIGLDVSGPDFDPLPIHKKLLAEDILIIENLTNLNQLQGLDFEVIALPIKLELDGAPARVIARVNKLLEPF